MDYRDESIWLMHGDCLDRMKEIPDGSVNLILCDLPYGTTQNKWDSIIDLTTLWAELKRIVKPNGAIVLFAQTPFDKVLGASNLGMLRYEWIWEKPKATGHLNAKKSPMKSHENILVFYSKPPTYNPQKTLGVPYKGSGGKSKNDNYGNFDAVREGSVDGSRYPRTNISFTHEVKPVHPTQKPVPLMEYMVKTYTNEGETVLDFTAGSFTTGVACRNLNRKFIGIEMDETYYNVAKDRILSK